MGDESRALFLPVPIENAFATCNSSDLQLRIFGTAYSSLLKTKIWLFGFRRCVIQVVGSCRWC